MISAEANERLTRVGPGTPMGTLLRRYWIPVRPHAQLLSEPVMKVRILGEDLVLFRTRKGGLGLIGDKCAHRFAGMEYGIPEDDGLRCCYHGWLYDPTGQCIETPLEAPESTFKERIKLQGYPVKEMGGLVWAYMGPAPAPLLAPWPILVWPNAVRQVGYTVLNCNWLQCQENTGDPTHSVYLHGHLFRYRLEKEGLLEERAHDQDTHRAYNSIRSAIGIAGIFAHPTPYGMEKGINYSKALGAPEDSARSHQTVIFPFFTGGNVGNGIFHMLQARVPIDDTHTYHIWYEMYPAPPGVEAPHQPVVPFFEYPYFDRQGKSILDYVLAQDMVGWWSQGAITERHKEKLGRTDIPIILLRRQLEQQMRIVEDGGEPLNVFRDPKQMEEIVNLVVDRTDEGAIKRIAGRGGSYREQYHKGYWRDDVGRYGPASELIRDLEQRAEEVHGAAR